MKIHLTLLYFFCAMHAFAQQPIYGKVTDQNGDPLPNASVFISESKIGTTTDTTGSFRLFAPASGSFKLVASFIGYETNVKTLVAAITAQNVTFIMLPLSKQLKEVIITSASNDNWKHWGEIFTDAFIGKSAYAAHCTIINPNVIGFEYDSNTQILHAYASEPIIVNNDDLGYKLIITLVDFNLYTTNSDVDYQAYYLFKEMQGDESQHTTWEQNRLKAYALSFMHFTRTLYYNKLADEGFEIRRLSIKENKEKQRIKKIYLQHSTLNTDLAGSKKTEISDFANHFFSKDSTKYYKKILAQKDNEIKTSELLSFKDIATKKDSNIIMLNFKDVLQVVYKKNKEPNEFYNYKNQLALATEGTTVTSTGISTSQVVLPVKEYPFTELWLLKGLPIEITKTGYINNTNLYMRGFWGWWEKIATRLPYEYQPN